MSVLLQMFMQIDMKITLCFKKVRFLTGITNVRSNSEQNRYSTNSGSRLCRHIVRYLKGTQRHGIKYIKYDGLSSDLIGFSDSDFTEAVKTRRFTRGYVFRLSNGPVTWASNKQTSVSLYTAEVEYVAASHATKEVIWWIQLHQDIDEEFKQPIPLYIDNQGAIRNPQYHCCRPIISIFMISNEQEANSVTKVLSRCAFERKLTDTMLKKL